MAALALGLAGPGLAWAAGLRRPPALARARPRRRPGRRARAPRALAPPPLARPRALRRHRDRPRAEPAAAAATSAAAPPSRRFVARAAAPRRVRGWCRSRGARARPCTRPAASALAFRPGPCWRWRAILAAVGVSVALAQSAVPRRAGPRRGAADESSRPARMRPSRPRGRARREGPARHLARPAAEGRSSSPGHRGSGPRGSSRCGRARRARMAPGTPARARVVRRPLRPRRERLRGRAAGARDAVRLPGRALPAAPGQEPRLDGAPRLPGLAVLCRSPPSSSLGPLFLPAVVTLILLTQVVATAVDNYVSILAPLPVPRRGRATRARPSPASRGLGARGPRDRRAASRPCSSSSPVRLPRVAAAPPRRALALARDAPARAGRRRRRLLHAHVLRRPARPAARARARRPRGGERVAWRAAGPPSRSSASGSWAARSRAPSPRPATASPASTGRSSCAGPSAAARSSAGATRAEAAAASDVVVLAAPPATNLRLLRRLARVARPGLVAHRRLERQGRDRARGRAPGPPRLRRRPPDGRHREARLLGFLGSVSSRARPGGSSPPGTAARNRVVRALVRAVGSRPVTTDAATHDRTMAFLSHLPQVVAWALLDAARRDPVARAHLRRAGPGFRGMTRLARSPRPLWRQILSANASRWRAPSPRSHGGSRAKSGASGSKIPPQRPLRRTSVVRDRSERSGDGPRTTTGGLETHASPDEGDRRSRRGRAGLPRRRAATRARPRTRSRSPTRRSKPPGPSSRSTRRTSSTSLAAAMQRRPRAVRQGQLHRGAEGGAGAAGADPRRPWPPPARRRRSWRRRGPASPRRSRRRSTASPRRWPSSRR